MSNFPGLEGPHIILKEGVPSERSVPFLQGMVDRMAVSFHKYGPVAKAYPDDVDAIESLEQRLDRYKEDGNTEWLMDVANFAMIEFMLPRHPDAHYRPTDSKESPGRIDTAGRQTGGKHNLDIEGARWPPVNPIPPSPPTNGDVPVLLVPPVLRVNHRHSADSPYQASHVGLAFEVHDGIESHTHDIGGVPVYRRPLFPQYQEVKDPYPSEENPKDLLGVRKAPIHLVPPALRLAAAPALADGAAKYGPYNWRTKAVKLSIYLAAAQRHIDAYWDGEELAPDSAIAHLGHAIACLAIIVDAEPIGRLVDDRPPPGPAPKLLAAQDRSKGITVERITLNDALAETATGPDIITQARIDATEVKAAWDRYEEDLMVRPDLDVPSSDHAPWQVDDDPNDPATEYDDGP